jgi:hypothetical protein
MSKGEELIKKSRERNEAIFNMDKEVDDVI